MSLDELRKKIDEIDDQISDLYVKRMEICKQIGIEKANQGSAVNVSDREKAVVNRITDGKPEEMKRYLKLLYDTVFFQSKNYQGKFVKAKSETVQALRDILANKRQDFPISASVACQGVKGAYSGKDVFTTFTDASLFACISVHFTSGLNHRAGDCLEVVTESLDCHFSLDATNCTFVDESARLCTGCCFFHCAFIPSVST